MKRRRGNDGGNPDAYNAVSTGRKLAGKGVPPPHRCPLHGAHSRRKEEEAVAVSLPMEVERLGLAFLGL